MKNKNDRQRRNKFPRPQSEQEIDALLSAETKETREPARLGSVAKPQKADGGPSQVQALLNLAGDIELFHAQDMRSYARVLVAARVEPAVAAHHEVLAIKAKAFESWLLQLYYEGTRGAPSGEALTMAVRTLEARAIHEGEKREVYIRVGSDGDATYLDLCDPAWRVIKITPLGWEVCEQSPIAFRRTSGELALPCPLRGGSLEHLGRYVNVVGDDFKLLIIWLLACFRPTGPFPVLILQGEQGSAKSTASKVLRLLVDPNVSPLRCEPRSQRDLMISAKASWLLAFDNLSGVWSWLSDTLCRLSTGGGITTRTLYTDDDETHINAIRPILLNGIDDVADRPDLLDGAILLRLPMIPEEKRQQESNLWSSFNAECPLLLGALLDAYAGALKFLPDVHLKKLPRMADFAMFGEAGGRFLGWGVGGFLKAYTYNIEGVTVSAADASPVARAVCAFMATRADWSGTSADLLEELNKLVSDGERRAKSWPTEARKLSGDLTRLAPVLRRLGLNVTRRETRSKKGRVIEITKCASPSGPETQSLPSLQSLSPENEVFSGNSTGDGSTAPISTVTEPSPASPDGNPLNENGLHDVGDGSDGSDGTPGALEPDADGWDAEAEWKF
jgi:hypothetical protein